MYNNENSYLQTNGKIFFQFKLIIALQFAVVIILFFFDEMNGLIISLDLYLDSGYVKTLKLRSGGP